MRRSRKRAVAPRSSTTGRVRAIRKGAPSGTIAARVRAAGKRASSGTIAARIRAAGKDALSGNIAARVRVARRAAGLSQSALAHKLGISRAAIAAWEGGAHEPGAANLRRAALILDVGAEWLATGDPTSRTPHSIAVEPDVVPVDPRRLRGITARSVRAALKGYRQAGVWEVRSDMLSGAGVRQGDYVIVDAERAPRPRDIVLALHAGEALVLRLYVPPYLYALPLQAQGAPLVVDGRRTGVKGVMVSRISA